jgi:capsular exopolysaccharide synthesis family protein
MSNFFESLQKAELIEAGDFALPRAESTSHPLTYETPATEVPAPDSSPSVFGQVRTVNLKISALSPIFPFTHETHAAAEQYRVIRTKVLHHIRRPKVIVVSSGDSGDGKTISSINIASSFALKRDIRVALIDADMRRPQISKLLGIAGTPGLGEVIAGAASFEEAAVCPEQFPNLCILPAGSPRNTQAELLDSPRWRALVGTLRQTFDYVIFDAPPIATVADYELVQQVSDGVIVIARPDHSERKLCLKALETVPKDMLVGVVLNCVDNWFLWRTNNYGYYAEAPQVGA